MARILAIEPDKERGALLRRLVAESLGAGVTLVSTAEEAIADIHDHKPDVILTSSLLPPAEDEHLALHLRLAPDLDHLPVLTMPALVDTPDAREASRGLLTRLRRFLGRQRPVRPTYDFSAVAARIEDALQQSREEADFSELERPARLWLLESHRPLLLAANNHVDEPLTASLQLVHPDEEDELSMDLDVDRIHVPRARRWREFELPWLQAIKLGWGANIRLVNISSTGLLVESGFRFTLGNRTDFNLVGPSHDLLVHARIVRSRRADQTGQNFVTAAVFDQPFDLLEPRGVLQVIQALDLSRTA